MRELDLYLSQRDAAGRFVGLDQADQLGQIGVEAFQSRLRQLAQRGGQHTFERSRDLAEQLQPERQDGQLDLPAIDLGAIDGDQLLLHQGADQVAGRGLVNVHVLSDAVGAESGIVPNQTEGPDLGAAQTDLAFNLLEMRAYGVEDDAELAQYVGMHGRPIARAGRLKRVDPCADGVHAGIIGDSRAGLRRKNRPVRPDSIP